MDNKTNDLYKPVYGTAATVPDVFNVVHKIEDPLVSTTPINSNVDHPAHYTQHPSGIECIQITECYNFCIGNAIKYLWRAGLKSDAELSENKKTVEDLKKAIWYINREIQNLEK